MAIQAIDQTLFALQTRTATYVLRITDAGLVENLYWGEKIACPEDFRGVSGESPAANLSSPQTCREECSSFGGMRFKETSLKAVFHDGVRDFRCRARAVRVEENYLEILLEDTYYPFAVRLHYQVFEEEDIVKKWRTAQNLGTDPVTLETFYSAEYSLPGTGYQSVNCRGRWGKEFDMVSEPVDSGKKIYESIFGLTGHTASPYFIVHRGASQTCGHVWFGVLEYSGNFKVCAEAVNADYLNLLIGVSDTDFSWRLEAGASFETPPVYSGWAGDGFEGMSRRLHRFCQSRLMPRPLADQPLPVLYNSWYATTFQVRCQDQIALAQRAAQLGVELFVVDDGWFLGRNDDTAGLGDWEPDPMKFPDGLGALIQAVRDAGMRFGLWIEPEMTNQKSLLYARHPDWIYRYDTRPVLMGRNQYELDLSNDQVVDYLISVFDKLLSSYDISYIKWDMNRYAAEMGSRALEASRWKELWHRNTLGIYRLIRELRARHPAVEFEACASGGGRVDYGAMRYFDEYWPSDNTDPLDRLSIQEAYSYVYPVKYMRSWFTDDYGMNCRRIPLQFSMYAAMCGSLGIGTDLNAASEEALKEIAGYVALYKRLRPTIQFGDLYRLASLSQDGLQAVQYVRGGHSVLFLFLDHERFGQTRRLIRLRGLQPGLLYRLRLRQDAPWEEKTGAFLMNYGLAFELTGDYGSLLAELEASEPR